MSNTKYYCVNMGYLRFSLFGHGVATAVDPSDQRGKKDRKRPDPVERSFS